MINIRTPREIELIADSCQIIADTLDMLEELIRPGVSVIDLDRMAEEFILSRGARPAFKGYLNYPSTLCVSVDDEVVHGIPNGRKLKTGQIVGIDCGAEKNGYFGDSARTFAVGDIDGSKRTLMEVTYQSLMLGISVAAVGNHVSDIGHAIQNHVEAHGYSVVRELVGHGIGMQLHEEPQIPNYGQPRQGYRLQAGMCLAIEPMINMGSRNVITDKNGWTVRTEDGKSSAHFEHTVVILENGTRILSKGQNNG